jgi:hypothetical protein
LEIVESTKPEGYEQWMERVRKQIEASPKAYSQMLNEDGSLASEKPQAVQIDNWDGQISRADAHPEGTNNMSQAERKTRAVEEEVRAKNLEEKEGVQPTVEDLEVEPPLTKEQYVTTPYYGAMLTIYPRINAIETKIGAGLIEEVIAVAEGELSLVDEMLRHQVYASCALKSPFSCFISLTAMQMGRAGRENTPWAMEILRARRASLGDGTNELYILHLTAQPKEKNSVQRKARKVAVANKHHPMPLDCGTQRSRSNLVA